MPVDVAPGNGLAPLTISHNILKILIIIDGRDRESDRSYCRIPDFVRQYIFFKGGKKHSDMLLAILPLKT